MLRARFTRKDEAAPGEGARQDRQSAQELASSREPEAGDEGGNRRRRRAEREGDDALRQGHREEPGTMVAQKSGTNRVILNTGWTALTRMLECKAANVIVVPAMNTSRTCHECGAVEAANCRTRDDFACLACGHAAHADLNAAKNIRDRALERLAAMDETSGTGDLHGEKRLRWQPLTREINACGGLTVRQTK